MTEVDKSKLRQLKNFGETIRDIRERRKILLRQVAASLEVDTALISKMERGERRAQREQVIKLAQFFEVAEETLMVVWLSDQILNVLQDEPLATQALKHSGKRINHR